MVFDTDGIKSENASLLRRSPPLKRIANFIKIIIGEDLEKYKTFIKSTLRFLTYRDQAELSQFTITFSISLNL